MILSSGLPVFNPEDANRDTIVNLEDAILNVRDLARTADNPESFVSGLGKAVSTLKVIAGLKTYYQPAKNATSSNSLSHLGLHYLIPSVVVINPSENSTRVSIVSSDYESLVFPPDTHPPRYM